MRASLTAPPAPDCGVDFRPVYDADGSNVGTRAVNTCHNDAADASLHFGAIVFPQQSLISNELDHPRDRCFHIY